MMITPRIALMLLCSFLLVTLAQANATIGQLAPDFTLPDTDGTQQTLADYRGKVVVLEWTNHDCPFVQKHYGANNMQTLQKNYTDQGVVWLSIISSAPGKQGHVSPEQANELTRSRNASPSAVLLDPEGTVGKSYDAKTTPHMYVIDKAGKLVYMGGIDDIRSADPEDIPKANNYVKAALDEVLSGKEVSTPTSRPYGCSIKYKGNWW